MDKIPEARSALAVLIGKQLSRTVSCGIMGFQFGILHRSDRGVLVGEHALHVICPWRLEANNKILTGSGDYHLRASDNQDEGWESGNPKGHLQAQILAALQSDCDFWAALIVRGVEVSDLGDVAIRFENSSKLLLFPSSSGSEDWRILVPGNPVGHFVWESAPESTR